MFDIGFSELLVIGIVALIVVGPQRLPKLARTAGHLLGRLQRYANQVKSDIKMEMAAEELKRIKEDMEKTAQGAEYEIRETQQSVERLAQSLTATELRPGDLDKKEEAEAKQDDQPGIALEQKPDEQAVPTERSGRLDRAE
jgi:sec-independent protein translocase protein TatB